MIVRKGFVLTAAAVLGMCSAAWADDASSTPASPTPLMGLLEQTSAGKSMADMGFKITGYFEAGYFHDLGTPGNVAGTRTFAGDKVTFPGAYKDQLLLDQADIAIEKDVDASAGKFDVGFKIEGIYGRDALFTHSNGILDNYNKHGGGPADQLDLEQAYVTVTPMKNLVITAGKFVTLLGLETINPTTNQFYTHSYIFSYGIPFTQTGILGTYTVSDKLSVTGGVTRGWNQSTSDNNGAVDGLFQFVLKANDKLTLTGNLSVGPEGYKDCSNYWFVPNLVAAYQVSDQLTVNFDLLYGDANSSAQWFGAAGYFGYTLNKYATLNGRFEFYSDGRGFTTGAPTTTNYAEGSIGVKVTPFPDNNVLQYLSLRPEVREDIANHSVFDGNPQQLSVAVDAIMQF